MSQLVTAFTGTGAGLEFLVPHGASFGYRVSGTFVGTVDLEQFVRSGWVTVVSKTSAANDTLIADGLGDATARYRWSCSAFTSGTINVSFKTVPAVPVAGHGVVAKELEFTETTGAGVYTGSVTVPAGASILDIIVSGIALWNPATSALLDVGDAGDADGYYTQVDCKATDLLAGESISFALAGGKAGAYIANSQVSPRYSASARTISAVLTTVGASGTTGRTRVTVVYHLPETLQISQATKV
jgi:hypothetical protein